MAIEYERIIFVDFPLIATPLNATTLNKMDKAIYDLDTEIGAKTDASSVTGSSVYAKIGNLYTAISAVSSAIAGKVTYNGSSVNSIDFSVSGDSLIITTS